MGTGQVQPHSRANKRLQCLLVNLLALVEVDGTPGVSSKTGVEQARWVLERSPLGKGHLHGALVRLSGADQAVVRPNRNLPFPLFDHFGVGLLDQCAEPGEHLPPPVRQLLDPLVDHPRRRLSLLGYALPGDICFFTFLLLLSAHVRHHSTLATGGCRSRIDFMTVLDAARQNHRNYSCILFFDAVANLPTRPAAFRDIRATVPDPSDQPRYGARAPATPLHPPLRAP